MIFRQKQLMATQWIQNRQRLRSAQRRVKDFQAQRNIRRMLGNDLGNFKVLVGHGVDGFSGLRCLFDLSSSPAN